jgi:hypothetical protein
VVGGALVAVPVVVGRGAVVVVVDVPGIVETVSTWTAWSSSVVQSPTRSPSSSTTGEPSSTTIVDRVSISTTFVCSAPCTATVSSGAGVDVARRYPCVSVGNDTRVSPASSSRSTISTSTTSPFGSRADITPERAFTAPVVVIAQPSLPIGVTSGSRGVCSRPAIDARPVVDPTACGDWSLPGVIEIASKPISSRLSVAAVAMMTRPLVDVGSWAGGPSSEGWRHGRSWGGSGARSTGPQRSDGARSTDVAAPPEAVGRRMAPRAPGATMRPCSRPRPVTIGWR